MGSYNKKSIKQKALKTRTFSRAAEKRVRQNIVRAQKEMLKEFDSHPATQELLQGADGANITKTLGNYGNLFSFIGFGEHERPVEKVRNLLIKFPRIKGGGQFRKDRYYFNVSIPTVEDLRFVAAMPWEAGKSWVEGIETGISGFGYYMSKLFGDSNKSRSGSAIQVDARIRGGDYKPTPYMSIITKKLITLILAGR